jgi:hypothetical protein
MLAETHSFAGIISNYPNDTYECRRHRCVLPKRLYFPLWWKCHYPNPNPNPAKTLANSNDLTLPRACPHPGTPLHKHKTSTFFFIMAEVASSAPQPAKNVVYCGVCSLPPEYCEFGGTSNLLCLLISISTNMLCQGQLRSAPTGSQKTTPRSTAPSTPKPPYPPT